jgi:N6-L-threonylcarbamoyladenine synthase
MLFLTIESTCDETAAAVVRDDLTVLSSVVASQDGLHARFGGVVPELASRAHVERILPVVDEALRRADVTLEEIGAVAVAYTPGLAGSLLVGVVAAKALSQVLGIPLIGVNHLHAHVYAARMAAERDIFPCVGLIVSGGHSNLYRCMAPIDFEYLGGTIDDAAGEAFDKVAAMLRLPFPGGPAVERTAKSGNRRAYDFPRAFLHEEDRLEFSFSGLKTAVRYQIAGHGQVDPASVDLDPRTTADLAASFQEAVMDCLVAKSLAALRRTGLKTLCVAGGVAANGRLRERFRDDVESRGFELIIPPLRWCTDNAAMGAIAVELWQAGLIEDLELDALPGLVRA